MFNLKMYILNNVFFLESEKYRFFSNIAVFFPKLFLQKHSENGYQVWFIADKKKKKNKKCERFSMYLIF